MPFPSPVPTPSLPPPPRPPNHPPRYCPAILLRAMYLIVFSGNPEDTPPASPLPPEAEELIVTDMGTGKQGNRRSAKGGRILFFEAPEKNGDGNEACLPRGRRVARKGLTVEGVVLREKRSEGGWAGLHCESDLIMCLMMLLLWEELFDPGVAAACGHCFTVRGRYRWESAAEGGGLDALLIAITCRLLAMRLWRAWRIFAQERVPMANCSALFWQRWRWNGGAAAKVKIMIQSLCRP